jgi:hydrogenase maturation factor
LPKQIKTIAATRSAAIVNVQGIASEAAAETFERLTGIGPRSQAVKPFKR